MWCFARPPRGCALRYARTMRYGGEEFLMVLPGCHGESALVQAERVREALCAMPFKACGHTLPVSCSIGVAFRSLPVPADAHTL